MELDHRIVVLKALVGSHNYNLNTESSDKDYKYCSRRVKFAKLRRSKNANSGRLKFANLSQSKRANHKISTAQIGCSGYG